MFIIKSKWLTHDFATCYMGQAFKNCTKSVRICQPGCLATMLISAIVNVHICSYHLFWFLARSSRRKNRYLYEQIIGYPCTISLQWLPGCLNILPSPGLCKVWNHTLSDLLPRVRRLTPWVWQDCGRPGNRLYWRLTWETGKSLPRLADWGTVTISHFKWASSPSHWLWHAAVIPGFSPRRKLRFANIWRADWGELFVSIWWSSPGFLRSYPPGTIWLHFLLITLFESSPPSQTSGARRVIPKSSTWINSV